MTRNGLLVLMILPLLAVGGCGFTDWLFLDPEQKAAIDGAEAAREEAKEAKAQLEAAKTDAEREAALARIALASAGIETSIQKVNDVIENSGGSNAERIGSILGVWFPWALGATATAAGVYKHGRARKELGNSEAAKGAIKELVLGIEDFSNTKEGEAMKAKVEKKLEKAGVMAPVNAALSALGLLKKSA